MDELLNQNVLADVQSRISLIQCGLLLCTLAPVMVSISADLVDFFTRFLKL